MMRSRIHVIVHLCHQCNFLACAGTTFLHLHTPAGPQKLIGQILKTTVSVLQIRPHAGTSSFISHFTCFTSNASHPWLICMKDLWNRNKFYSILFFYSPTFTLSTLGYKTVHFTPFIKFRSCRL